MTGEVIQGAVGTCYFLGALSTLVSSHPTWVQQLVVAHDVEVGVYGVRFFWHGTWEYVVVDDHIACTDLNVAGDIRPHGARKMPLYAKCRTQQQNITMQLLRENDCATDGCWMQMSVPSSGSSGRQTDKTIAGYFISAENTPPNSALDPSVIPNLHSLPKLHSENSAVLLAIPSESNDGSPPANLPEGVEFVKSFQVPNSVHFMQDSGKEFHTVRIRCGEMPLSHSVAKDPAVEVWVGVMEKAYAKFKGGYNQINGGDARAAMVDLTGGVMAPRLHLPGQGMEHVKFAAAMPRGSFAAADKDGKGYLTLKDATKNAVADCTAGENDVPLELLSVLSKDGRVGADEFFAHIAKNKEMLQAGLDGKTVASVLGLLEHTLESALINCFVPSNRSAAHGPQEALLQNGLVSGHAYGILGVVPISENHVHGKWVDPNKESLFWKLIIGGPFGALATSLFGWAKSSTKTPPTNHLVQLRNPWGIDKWNGAWSDGSSEWEQWPDLQKRLRPIAAQDGIFFMSIEDFASTWHYMDAVCPLHGLYMKRASGSWSEHAGPNVTIAPTVPAREHVLSKHVFVVEAHEDTECVLAVQQTCDDVGTGAIGMCVLPFGTTLSSSNPFDLANNMQDALQHLSARKWQDVTFDRTASLFVAQRGVTSQLQLKAGTSCLIFPVAHNAPQEVRMRMQQQRGIQTHPAKASEQGSIEPADKIAGLEGSPIILRAYTEAKDAVSIYTIEVFDKDNSDVHVHGADGEMFELVASTEVLSVERVDSQHQRQEHLKAIKSTDGSLG
eukprot:gene20788-31886_t